MDIEKYVEQMLSTPIGRRKAAGVVGLGALGFGAVILGVGELLDDTPNLSTHLKEIESFTAERNPLDVLEINTTEPYFDLKYLDNPRIAEIRATPDFRKKILAGIGYLDVMKSRRYDHRYNTGVNTCNIYAVDLLRILLNNEADYTYVDPIGSRVDRETQRPLVLEGNQFQPETMTAQSAADWDRWMEANGYDYGWIKAQSRKELKEYLRSGYIGFGMTSMEYLASHQSEGHNYVVMDVGDGFGVTQSTVNRTLRPIGYRNSEDAQTNIGERNFESPLHYSIWVHEIPTWTPVEDNNR